MRHCCQRLQTDRNTPTGFKIDFSKFIYNGFFCYNGFIKDFLDFYRFLTCLRSKVEIGGVRIIMESQSGGRPNEDIEMSSAPSFGALGGHIFDVAAPSRTEKT
jgi:hypothetical protein